MRTADVSCRTLAGAVLEGSLTQSVQNSALPRGPDPFALPPQATQLLLQLLKLLDPRGHVRNVLIEQCMGRFAVIDRAIAQAKQLADLIECHIQRTTVADERQAFEVRPTVESIVSGRAIRLGEEALALVIADRFGRTVRPAREFADLEVQIHGGLTLKLLQGFHYTLGGPPMQDRGHDLRIRNRVRYEARP